MKKTGIVCTVLGGLLIAYLIISTIKMRISLSIIGGADGPTAVFYAGKLPSIPLIVTVLGVLLLVVGIILLVKKK